MAGHAFGFIAKMNAGLGVAADLVFAEEIVRVFVTDGNSEAAISLQNIFFERAEFHAPAEKQTILLIVFGDASAHSGTLRTAAGMQAQPRVIFRNAIIDHDVIGLLEADAIAIVIANRA